MDEKNSRQPAATIRLGSLVIDTERRSVERGGQAVAVESRVYDLLVYLACRQGRICTKTELLDAIWGDRVVSESTLYRAVRLARELLEAEPGHRIRTVHARGYELIGPVSIHPHTPADVAAGPSGNPSRAAQEPIRSPSWRGHGIAALAVVGLAAVFALSLQRFAWNTETIHDDELVVTIGEFEAPVAASEFPVDGLLADLRSELARVDGLRLRRALRQPPPRSDRVLRGSWSQGISGDLQLQVELIDPRSDRLVWSANFQREFEHADELRRDVSDALIRALDLEPRNLAGESLPLPVGSASSGYSEYLRARELWRQRSAASLERARRLLENVILEAPAFARAHEALASVYLVLPDWSDLPRDETRRLAGSAAREALRLQPRLGEARAVLAQLALARGQWREAERLFVDALMREGGNPTIRHWYAEFLIRVGQIERAHVQALEARALDPLTAMPALVGGWTALLQGQNDSAQEYAAQALAAGLDAAALIRAWAGARLGDRRASDWLAQLPQPTEFLPDCRVADDDQERRADLVRRIEASAREDELALIYSLSCLAMAGAIRPDHSALLPPANSSAFGLLWAEEFRPIRLTPEFRRHVEAAGLIEYWSSTTAPDACALIEGQLDCSRSGPDDRLLSGGGSGESLEVQSGTRNGPSKPSANTRSKGRPWTT